MNPLLEQVLTEGDDPYNALPESIKAVISRNEYNWMTDGQKATLLQDETEPEIY